MHNFNRPFFATSMAEFWRRWHISLIKWLTDYVYTPLAFRFRSLNMWGIVIALMVTFILSGIWHELSLNQIVWGFITGTFLCTEAIINKRRSKFVSKYNLKSNVFYITFSIIATYFLFATSEVFGTVKTFDESMTIFSKIITERGRIFLDMTTLAYAAIGVFILLASDFRDEYYPKKLLFFDNKNSVIRFGSYLFISLLILWIGILNGGQFIYFQF